MIMMRQALLSSGKTVLRKSTGLLATALLTSKNHNLRVVWHLPINHWMRLKKGWAHSCMVATSTYWEVVTASWVTSKNQTMKQTQRLTTFPQQPQLSLHLSLASVDSLTQWRNGHVAVRVRICESKQSFKRSRSETQYWKRRRRLNSKMTSTLSQITRHLRPRWIRLCLERRLH